MTPTSAAPKSRPSQPASYTPNAQTSAGAGAVPFPLVLQRRAQTSRRDHVTRGAIRVSALLAVDVAVLMAVRGVLHWLRDAAFFGQSAAAALGTVMPRGTLAPTQLVPAVLAGLALVGCYAPGDARRESVRLWRGVCLGVALVAWSRVTSAASLAPLPALLVAAALLGTSVIAARHAVDAIVRRVRPASAGAARALIVGRADDARHAVELDVLRDPAEFIVVGFLTMDGPAPSDALGDSHDLAFVIQEQQVDTIILVSQTGDDETAATVTRADAAGCQVLLLPRAFDLARVAPSVISRRGVPFVQLTRPALRGRHLVLKRAIDLVGAAALLVLAAPVMVVIAAAVWLSSPGPVLFRQVRVGLGGRHFRMLKFRSMVRDAEARRAELAAHSLYTDGRLFKVARDPRVTRTGAFLRRTSLDELPQLWNVLRGEMSLVGPRPPVPSEVALYEEHHYSRFDMRPGLTGPWQVGGRNRVTDFEQVIRLETEYMRHWNLWKDAMILLRTIPAVLGMGGAH